jgi:predicted nucleic acid-binding protein
MIVADTNLIAYLNVTGERSRQAEQAFRKDPDWVAPFLWRSEFRNVLALYLRKGYLTLEGAREIMDAALDLMSGQEYDVDSAHVLGLAAESACSAYDCEFVALAQNLGVRLVTVDKRILREFPGTAVSLDSYVAE